MPRITSKGVYLGIDPGQSGAIARVEGRDAFVLPMPSSYKDLFHWIARSGANFCVIERVHAMPSQGVTSMFTFGKGFGALLMAVTAADISFEEVNPEKWQKALGVQFRVKHTKTRETVFKSGPRKGKVKVERYGGEDTIHFKRRLRSVAEGMFPNAEGVTDKTADALLIAEFARRYREGLLNA